MEAFLLRSIYPKLEQCMIEFKINPHQQLLGKIRKKDMESFYCIEIGVLVFNKGKYYLAFTHSPNHARFNSNYARFDTTHVE